MKIIAHGILADMVDGPHEFAVSSPAAAIQLLIANFPKIHNVIRNGAWHVVRGSLDDDDDVDSASEDDLNFETNVSEIHILPAIEGSGGGNDNTLKTILGIAIIGVAIFASGGVLGAGLGGLTSGLGGQVVGGLAITWGNIAGYGAIMALSGVSSMLSPIPTVTNYDSSGKSSFLFAGAVNVSNQGGPVPVLYGRLEIGSFLMSVDIKVEDVV